MLWRETDSEGRELVRDCEAFLTGRYLEHLLDRGDYIPTWAWTNLLAHGSIEQLQSPPTSLSVNWADLLEPWLQARAYLAGEVLNATYRGVPLCRLQRTKLIPLELRLSSSTSARSLGPADWVTLVMTTITPLSSWKHSTPRK